MDRVVGGGGGGGGGSAANNGPPAPPSANHHPGIRRQRIRRQKFLRCDTKVVYKGPLVDMVTYPNGVQSYILQQFKYSGEQPTSDEWKKAGKIKDRQIVRTILRFFAADKLLEADPARVEAMMDLIQETKENKRGQK